VFQDKYKSLTAPAREALPRLKWDFEFKLVLSNKSDLVQAIYLLSSRPEIKVERHSKVLLTLSVIQYF
jgi:hypothetical protein